MEELTSTVRNNADNAQQANQAVTSMDETTQQNAALAEQTSAASASMTNKARELNHLVA